MTNLCSALGLFGSTMSRACLLLVLAPLVDCDRSAWGQATTVAAPPQERTWQDNSGKFRVQATLVEVRGGTVKLRKLDGMVISVPLSRLSKEDRRYLDSSPGKPAQPPGEKPADQALSGRTTRPEDALSDDAVLYVAARPLREVLDSLADRHRFNIIVDAQSLQRASLRPDVPVTLQAERKKLNALLDELLTPIKMGWIVRHDAVIVTSYPSAIQSMLIVVYRAKAAAPRQSGSRRADLGEVAAQLQKAVHPTTWGSVGGPGETEVLSDLGSPLLVVRQSRSAHAEIERQFGHWLTAVRPPGAAAGVRGAGRGKSAVHKSLADAATLSATAQPLSEVVAAIARQHHVALSVDDAAIRSAGLSSDVPVTLRVGGIPLSSVIDLVAASLGLYVVADGDQLRITTLAVARAQLVKRTYPTLRPGDADGMVRLLEHTIAPSSWRTFAGPGTIEFNNTRTQATIEQSAAVHKEIEALLAAIKEATR